MNLEHIVWRSVLDWRRIRKKCVKKWVLLILLLKCQIVMKKKFQKNGIKHATEKRMVRVEQKEPN